VNTRSLRSAWSARVYTIAIVFIVALAMTATDAAQMPIRLEPVMTKGPASAPVTIVEFSDYQ
jgi:protein-disulfide isomerase